MSPKEKNERLSLALKKKFKEKKNLPKKRIKRKINNVNST